MSKYEVESESSATDVGADLVMGAITGLAWFLVPRETEYTVRDTDTGERFSVNARDRDHLGQQISDGKLTRR